MGPVTFFLGKWRAFLYNFKLDQNFAIGCNTVMLCTALS
jgi:hypothetical protein